MHTHATLSEISKYFIVNQSELGSIEKLIWFWKFLISHYQQQRL